MGVDPIAVGRDHPDHPLMEVRVRPREHPRAPGPLERHVEHPQHASLVVVHGHSASRASFRPNTHTHVELVPEPGAHDDEGVLEPLDGRRALHDR